MTNREILLKRLQICDFVLIETGLFLNTHPDNQDALTYYQKHLKLRQETLEEYERRYGPVTQQSQPANSDRWEWVNGPWPWENKEV